MSCGRYPDSVVPGFDMEPLSDALKALDDSRRWLQDLRSGTNSEDWVSTVPS
jgi:hypothetical protein